MIEDMLLTGFQFLEEKRSKWMTRPATLIRGEYEVPWDVTVGSHISDVDESDGMQSAARFQDFIGSVATLVLFGEKILPDRGDRIILDIEGVKYAYEVIQDGSEDYFRFTDSSQLSIRVHTVEIGQD